MKQRSEAERNRINEADGTERIGAEEGKRGTGLFRDIMEKTVMSPERTMEIRTELEAAGTEKAAAVKTEEASGYRVRIHGLDDRFYGVYEYIEEKGLYCPVKMFFPE